MSSIQIIYVAHWVAIQCMVTYMVALFEKMLLESKMLFISIPRQRERHKFSY